MWCVQADASGVLSAVSGDPATCPAVLLSGAEAAGITALQTGFADTQSGVQALINVQTQPLDSAEAAQIFGIFLGVPLTLFAMARGFGGILAMIRKG